MAKLEDQEPDVGLTPHLAIGDRYGELRDPFGHIWSIGAPCPPANE